MDLSLLIVILLIFGVVLGCILSLLCNRNKRYLFFLSPKRMNSDIPLGEVVTNLKICNEYSKEDFKNEKYKQEKLRGDLEQNN